MGKNYGSKGGIRTLSLSVNSRVLHRWATLENYFTQWNNWRVCVLRSKIHQPQCKSRLLRRSTRFHLSDGWYFVKYARDEILISHTSSNQQRSTLPGSYPPSTIDAGGLYFCVRYGNRCCPSAIITGYNFSFQEKLRVGKFQRNLLAIMSIYILRR